MFCLHRSSEVGKLYVACALSVPQNQGPQGKGTAENDADPYMFWDWCEPD